jgi:sugar/nucleoside kinase (ribokinase family)
MFGLKRKPRILLIGASHLDVFADYPAYSWAFIDKVGSIHFAFGGTAFNIAMNLARRGMRISFLTALKKNSIISDIIMFKLEGTNINTRYIQHIDTDQESGFVAHRETGRLVSAVTATLLDRTTIGRAVIRRAINKHDVIVIDCNATEHQIVEVAQECARVGKLLLVAAVSDTKARRLRAAEFAVPDCAVATISMNEREARSIDIDVDQFTTDMTYADAVMARLRTTELCITRGKSGLVYRARNSQPVTLPAPLVSNVATTSGAGDAVMSAIIDWKTGDDRSLDELKKLVTQYVVEVLLSEGSNTGAVITTDQFIRLRRKLPLIIRIGQNAIIFNYVTLTGTVLSAVAIAAAILHWW